MKRPEGRGRSLVRGDPGFDTAVLATSFNGRDPGRRPAALVEANDEEDVAHALERARKSGLQISICSGGHSWAQNHIREGSLLLSMARFNGIDIDPQARIARVGPGCWSIDLDRAARRHGLFFPVAHAPDVCMGGFLLQGGFGWGSRALGIATQSVIGLDLMLADGRTVHASDNENPELYWAARGAGPGFFAVVLRYHLKLHSRHQFSGMKMQVFPRTCLDEVFAWADEIGPDVARSVEFQMLITPKALGTFKPGIEVIAPVLAGSRKQAQADVRFLTESPLRRHASFTTPLLPVSTSFMSNTANLTHFPAGVRWCADNLWLDAPIDRLLPGLSRIADTMPPAPSHALWLNWEPPATRPDMAFSLESRRYLAVYGMWRDAGDDARYQGWATERISEMAEHGLGIQLADENLGQRPARFMAESNLEKLDRLRSVYDPEDLFCSWMGRL